MGLLLRKHDLDDNRYNSMSKTPDHLFTVLKTKQSLHSFILDGNTVQGVRLFAEQAGGPKCEFPIPMLKTNKHKTNKHKHKQATTLGGAPSAPVTTVLCRVERKDPWGSGQASYRLVRDVIEIS